jgi:hypothetical protein
MSVPPRDPTIAWGNRERSRISAGHPPRSSDRVRPPKAIVEIAEESVSSRAPLDRPLQAFDERQERLDLRIQEG